MEKDNHISITLPEFEKIQSLPNKENSLSLYLLCQFLSKKQSTDKINATTSSCAKELRWSDDRVRQAKKSLISIGFIKDLHASGKESKA